MRCHLVFIERIITMKKKHLWWLLLFLPALLLITGNMNNIVDDILNHAEWNSLAPTPNEINAFDAITNIYSEKELEEICSWIRGSNPSLQSINTKYPIQYLEKHNDRYRVIYRGYEHVVILWYYSEPEEMYEVYNDYIYHTQDEHLSAVTMFQTSISKSHFDNIICGETSLGNIINLRGHFVYEVAEPYSYHITSDGYQIYISYGEKNGLKTIVTEVSVTELKPGTQGDGSVT